MIERGRGGGGGVIRLPLADCGCDERGDTEEVGPGETPRDKGLGVGVDPSYIELRTSLPLCVIVIVLGLF